MSATPRGESEWLETDGEGGFAMGRVDQLRTRRYHAWLVVARKPPGDRVVLVNGGDVSVEIGGRVYALVQQRYAPGVTAPADRLALREMTHLPWPRWTYELPNGGTIEQELVVAHGGAHVALSWRARGAPAGARLRVRPFLSGRGPHETHHENPVLSFDAALDGDDVVWRTYASVPAVRARTNGEYRHEPYWYRNFEYDEERARGLDFLEDLAAPGEFAWPLGDEAEAVLVLEAEEAPAPRSGSARDELCALREREARRRTALGPGLRRAADAYIVRRGEGKTIVAGYPWFTDWGRDSFIALRGLCIAGGRWSDARDVLVEWALTVSEGMLPNYFPESGAAPEYNSVDASLWYAIAVHDLLASPEAAHGGVVPSERLLLEGAVAAIVAGYAAGTRWGIHMDADALLAAGAAGTQLTWMDARADGREVTPRVGKPVEVQALWINALLVAARREPRWAEVAARARVAFAERFWSDARGHLADVVDVDHAPGTADWSMRPNQLFAVGGLPSAVLDGARARCLVDAAERALWTVAGPRSLAPGEPGYRGRYEGGPVERDGAYHQGTVWPWLAGAFIDAWVRTHGNDEGARRQARRRFLEPMIAHYAQAGLGHLAELADGDWPHTPRGAPFQAWSLGEVMRVEGGTLRGRDDGARY